MYTWEQKKKAVERELSFRRRVYPRFIEQKKMTQRLADEQIAIFEDILADYTVSAEKERLL